MEKHLLMDCRTVINACYETEEDGSLSLLAKIRIGLHILFCPSCYLELKCLRNNLQYLEEIMKTDFFPFSPGFESIIMERLLEYDIKGSTEAPAGFSTRLWIVIGFFVLLSLSTSFFGMDFVRIAKAEGLSFLLPVGITVGVVLTCYGALFIGSHLEEFSNRFRVR